MKDQLLNIRGNILLVGMLLLLVGLLLSKVLISIGVILLGILSLVLIDFETIKESWIKKSYVLFLPLVFILFFVSGIWSSDTGSWWKAVQMKLPFLFLPLTYLQLKGLNKGKVSLVIEKSFTGVTVLFLLVSLYSIWPTIKDIGSLKEMYSKGQVLHLPINHIRFSLFAAVLVLFNAYYLMKGQLWRWIPLIFLIAVLHWIAVRSGLIALYVGSSVTFLSYVIKKRKYFVGVTAFLLAGIFVWAAVNYVPTLERKIAYTKYDIEQYLSNSKDVANYSDARRLMSFKVGASLLSENLAIGVGIGDIKQEVKDRYDLLYKAIPSEKRLLPHNQYLRYFVAFGLLLGSIFLVLFHLPFFISNIHSIWFQISSIFAISFLMEGTLDTQIGTTLFLVFTLLSYWLYNNEQVS